MTCRLISNNFKSFNMRFTAFKFRALAACLAFVGTAAAQTAGTVMLKGGYNQFHPQVKSGDITGVPGAQVGVGKAGNAFGALDYMLTNNVSTELAFGVPPKHDIHGSGLLFGVRKIASSDILPATLSIKYRFLDAQSTLRPFVGLGIVRAVFRNSQGDPTLTALTNPSGPQTAISIDAVWGVAAQIGASYALSDRWFIEGAIAPSFIKTTARLSTGQTVDLKINPVGVNLAIGYRF